jgi:hypothetical protein
MFKCIFISLYPTLCQHASNLNFSALNLLSMQKTEKYAARYYLAQKRAEEKDGVSFIQ